MDISRAKFRRLLMNATHPAPCPDVNALLLQLLSGTQAILGDHFAGMHLFGLLAGGDFDQDSDIDVLVVMDEEVSGGLFSALQALHATSLPLIPRGRRS
jgi:Nucleotidyltransferase domain